MSKETMDILTESDLEGAAYLCLAAAATTDVGLLEFRMVHRRIHHERRRRFEKAQAKMKEGITSLLELGLLPQDCAWAICQASLTKDQEGWSHRFQTAENKLRKALSRAF